MVCMNKLQMKKCARNTLKPEKKRLKLKMKADFLEDAICIKKELYTSIGIVMEAQSQTASQYAVKVS